MTHAKNDLVLIVINDGNGSQCGMTYDQRCADTSIAAYRMAASTANLWRMAHGEAPATREDVFFAATEIREYYLNHNAESRAILAKGN